MPEPALTFLNQSARFPALFSENRNTSSSAPPPKTSLAAILLGLACSVLTGLAQLGLKWGANRLPTSGLLDTGTLSLIFFSYLLFGVGLVFFLLALRRGELTTVYPLLAARYVWVVAVTPLAFPADVLNLYKLLGAALAALGVFAVARGGLK